MSQDIVLNDGNKMPIIGIGTWKLDATNTKEVVSTALDVGYRLVDCAALYQNEKEVGKALAEWYTKSNKERKDVFITSKVWNHCHEKGRVTEACEETLKDLQTDYLDLYLIHWPVSVKYSVKFGAPEKSDFIDVPLTETWKEMEKLQEQGRVKSIGVSNFTISQLEQLNACKVKPAVNQIEWHVLLQQPQLVEYCRKNGIALTGYYPLGANDSGSRTTEMPNLMTLPEVVQIAAKHERTPAQVLLRYAIQNDIAIIPKSRKRERIAENFAIFDFVLDEDDIKVLKGLDKHMRINKGWKYLGNKTVEEFWEEK